MIIELLCTKTGWLNSIYNHSKLGWGRFGRVGDGLSGFEG
jgi:hypothetical protein